MNILRSDLCPTTSKPDSDPDEPTLEKSGDEQDIMERIKNTLDKHDEV
jgi:hypothetical protein